MKVIALALILAVVPFGGTAGAQSTGGEDPSTLSVQGAGEIRVAPDLATVRLGVAEQAPTAQEAQQAVNRIANAILEAVAAAGIAERHIQTARLMLSPVYARPRPDAIEEPRIVAYRASNTVTVRVENLADVGAVIDAALGAGANQLEGVSFELTDDREVRENALRAAVAEARRKAQVMAEALGVRLESVLAINESGVIIQRPMMEMGRAFALQDVSTPVSPGEITISASVSIQYRIQEAP